MCITHETILRQAIIVIFYLRSTIVMIIYSNFSKIFRNFYWTRTQSGRTKWMMCVNVEWKCSVFSMVSHLKKKKGRKPQSFAHTMLKINFKCVSSLHLSVPITGTWQLLSKDFGVLNFTTGIAQNVLVQFVQCTQRMTGKMQEKKNLCTNQRIFVA